ncbi:MAG: 4Fe-4S binding protein [Clostridiaceae bacterium]|nr:4Fe-4S binding protein [Clostridiaceae bacterium]
MKQLLILSGKGGTGKTTIASAFIKLAAAKAYADCDVDAPNLHLVSDWDQVPESSDYFGMDKALINPDLCSECDLCRQHCRFDAITIKDTYTVDPFACEGCAVCEYICPEKAIEMQPAQAGQKMLYRTAATVFSTARLKMGSGNSGLLVSEVKSAMKAAAAPGLKLAIIDGSPGIGCPVIASLSGVDMVLLVAEPSVSGISDLKRVLQTAAKFGVKAAVCINKFDSNLEQTEKIEEFCKKYNLPVLGNIPFDEQAVKAINSGKSIVDIDCISGRAVQPLFYRTMRLLFDD